MQANSESRLSRPSQHHQHRVRPFVSPARTPLLLESGLSSLSELQTIKYVMYGV
jgi:hypothetical protein